MGAYLGSLLGGLKNLLNCHPVLVEGPELVVEVSQPTPQVRPLLLRHGDLVGLEDLGRYLKSYFKIQGGPSSCGQPFVDIEVRVALLDKKFILRLNF